MKFTLSVLAAAVPVATLLAASAFLAGEPAVADSANPTVRVNIDNYAFKAPATTIAVGKVCHK